MTNYNAIKSLSLMIFIMTSFYCGELSAFITRNNGRTSRIVGGQNATASQFPFSAAIQVRTANSAFFCGGTLFYGQWIITAGQCVYGAVSFTIQLGSIHLNQDDPNRITLATAEYFLHPDFNPNTLENDIGIIKLREKVSFTDYLRAIDMLPVYDLGTDVDLSATGWGQTSDGSGTLASTLQYAKVVAITNDECKITYGNQVKDTMVCVGGNYNEGSCHGDTGSPLVEMYSNRFTVLSGIASFISGNGCESTDPSGYTRTFSHKPWIRNVTQTW